MTYGITPPKRSFDEARRREVAARQRERIAGLPVDGVVIYDLQDESTRTDAARPFPFMETVDSVEYGFDYLGELRLPKVVYRCVAPRETAELRASLARVEAAGGLTVLVGAAARTQPARTRLSEAYAICREELPQLPVGGVAIAERHEAKGGEERRLIEKMAAGCSFFVSQAVYAPAASKNLLSDLYYRCAEDGRAVPPLLVTLSPCGSRKTLEFLRWLGISVPRWLENELLHAHDILQTSVDLCCQVFSELLEFARAKDIPLGCNVESVSLKKEEIEASVELVHRVAQLLGRAASPPG
ncbi:MAG: 5,10-methylenetetrahydrofolate reductase [Polyangiaceae bacterium]